MVEKMCIIVSKGTLDMAYPPFILATTAAAMGFDVHMFFTFWGLNILVKGKADKLKLPGAMSLFTGMMKKKMKKLNIPSISEFIKKAKEAGVKLYACETTMQVMDIKPEDLIPEVDNIVGASTFMDLASDSKMVLFI